MMIMGIGCKVGKDADKECVDPPEAVAAKGTKSPSEGKASEKKVVMSEDDVNWCRACVVGPHGFMSCQRVNQSNTAETEEQLREKARIAACTDSGFTETNCPPDKVISVACKGDPPPKDKRAAGEALLKALKNSGPLVLTEDGTRLEKIKKKVSDAKKDNAQADAPSSAISPEKPGDKGEEKSE